MYEKHDCKLSSGNSPEQKFYTHHGVEGHVTGVRPDEELDGESARGLTLRLRGSLDRIEKRLAELDILLQPVMEHPAETVPSKPERGGSVSYPLGESLMQGIEQADMIGHRLDRLIHRIRL